MAPLKYLVAVVLLGVMGAACTTADATAPRLGMSRQAMVGGTVSTATQDSVVFVMKGQDESCSGTLIAPNLVLTARHCVAEPNESDDECVGYGPTVDPATMAIKLGASSNWDVGVTVATGKSIFTPGTVNMCGYDVALILLNQDVPGAQISPIRFTDIKPNEAAITVGYGVDGNDNDLPKRMQRSTTVLGVGPTPVIYTEKDGTVFNYPTPDGDVVTGESTCFGDSGGPLFDMDGNIIAMTSRGPAKSPTGGEHGNGCIDMVSVYASAKLNEPTIRYAAIQAGHPLPTVAATTASTSAGQSGAEDSSDSSEDDPPAKTTKKKKSSTVPDVSTAGCSAAPGGEHGDAWVMVAGVAIAIAAVRRRRAA